MTFSAGFVVVVPWGELKGWNGFIWVRSAEQFEPQSTLERAEITLSDRAKSRLECHGCTAVLLTCPVDPLGSLSGLGFESEASLQPAVTWGNALELKKKCQSPTGNTSREP